jgi:hypothetical protein
VVSDDDLARFVLATSPAVPRREIRSFGTERGVVTVAGMHHRGVIKTVEDLASRSFIKDVKSSGLLVLPGPPGNTRARCPMVKFGAVHVPHQAQGLGGSRGHGSSRHGIESGSWTSAFLMPLPVTACKALMAIREPPILLGELHHALVGSVRMCWRNGRRGVLVASRWASRNAHTVTSDSCDAVRPDSAHDLPT